MTAASLRGLDLEKISLEWERQTGNDSIPTIKAIYEQTEAGAYKCVWSGCSFARRDADVVWLHVHGRHGNSLPPEVRDARKRQS